MSSDRLPGAVLPLLYVLAVLVLSAAGVVLMLRHERRNPSSYTGRPAAVERPSDQVALDAAEMREQGRLRTQAEWRAWQPDAVADASEAAQMAEAAKRNALFHP